MNKLTFFSSLTVLLSGWSLFAAPVSETGARKIAERFAAAHPLFARTGVSYQVASLRLWRSFWVAELSPRGYIVLSDDDTCPPLRVFSTEGSFSFAADHPSVCRLSAVADTTSSDSVSSAGRVTRTVSSVGAVSPYAAQWASLRGIAVSVPRVAGVPAGMVNQTVGPLVTSTWGQGLYYNAMCPVRDDGASDNGGHMVNGCVAVAGAQVLRYHAWPPRGIGAKAHYAQKSDLTRPMLWSKMLDAYPEFGEPQPWENIRAVAWLCMDVGSLVDMNYGNDGSSSELFSLHSYLPKYFHYMENARALQSSAMTPDELGEACVSDLDDGNPVLTRSVIYTDESKTDGTGHAWLVDGYYRDDTLGLLLHANYGWDGQNNDWYPPAAMHGSGELLGAIVGLVPHPFPLFRPVDGVCGPSFTLTWDVPKKYEGTYEAFRIKEGVITEFEAVDLSDMALWTIGENYEWTAQEDGGWDMTGGLAGQPGLRDPIIAHAGAQLVITHKLPDSVTVTPYVYNGEDVWAGEMTEFLSLPAGDGFMTSRFDIPAARLDRPMRIDLGVINNGPWGSALSGVIKKIEVTNCEGVRWTLVNDTIPGTARSFNMSGVSEGRYFYCIESKRNGAWDTRLFDETERLPVTVADTAVPAPILSVDETQIVSPWTPPLMLHIDVKNPSGRPLTFVVEDTGYSVADQWSDMPPLLPPSDFSFTNIAGETFLVLPECGKITTKNLSTWVKISAATPEGAKGTTWFVLGAFKKQQTMPSFTDKTSAFAAALAETPSKKVLLIALNSAYDGSTFNKAVNSGLNDSVNRAILSEDYVMWQVDVADTNTWAAVAPFAKVNWWDSYDGGQFVCRVDPVADAREGDKVTGFYTETFRDVIDPDGTRAAAISVVGAERPQLRPVVIDSANGMSLLISPTSPQARYAVLSSDSLTTGFTTTNTFRFAGETQERQSFIGPRGAAILEIPFDPTARTQFFKVMMIPVE